MTKTRDMKPQPPMKPKLAEKGQMIVTIRGSLRFADRIRSAHQIKLVDEKVHEHRILVPQGMMRDIVKPLWEDEVVATGIQKGRHIELTDIRKAES